MSRLFIRNFRSIKELDLTLHPGKNVIVGRNNSGKSNIIKALDIVLGESSPDYARSENITANDFHTFREAGEDGPTTISDHIFIWCEITRGDEEVLNYEELYKCYGFYRCNQQRYGPAMRFDTLPEVHDDAFLIDQDEHDGKTYVNPKLRNQQTLEGELDDKYRFAIGFKARRDGNKIIKEARLFYRESDGHNWMMAFKANIRNELLQSAIIPSFRDPQQQLRLSTWTWYGKLIKHLTANHDQLPALERAYGRVSTVANTIFADVREQVTRSALNVAFPGTELFFQLNPDTQMELYKSCLIYVDDGFKSLLVDKGSGIQSATIMGLFTYYVQNVNTVTSALLCVEEPELYLHPHARRVISQRLSDFIGDRHQVILTTHSAEFLRFDGQDIHVISVRNDREFGTRSVAIDLKEFAGVLIDDAANEVFFADKVIVCEGFDDFVLRAIANELSPGQLDAQNVSIIRVGGKDQISRLVKLMRRLGTQCFVVADFDYLLRDQNEACREHNARPHESLQSLGMPFFAQSCTFGARGREVFLQMQRLRTTIRRDDIAAFYTATKASEVGNAGVNAFIEECRSHGVCILPGQIEDCCIDGTFGQNRKLSLERLYALSGRLASGERINSIFDVTDFEAFFRHVLAEAAVQSAGG